MIGKLRRAVRAKYFARLNASHGFNQLIIIGVVRQWQRMIDAEAILCGLVFRPTGDGDRYRFSKPRQPKRAGGSGQRNDRVTVERLAVVQAEVAEIDPALLINATYFVYNAVLQHRNAAQS